ncbi:BLUF domain-containing protein [Nocardioides marmotae]|uniref:Blue light sensor protein n=1 Tax=Nocardioides marmotae TaxID=2663857 RepID=A0A6I3IX74_9ACTN|nr:BLUF domain-containing protein [Nocardioides marmotae]MBC9733636.1 BLUF domain-containing protein [Nocardioides marmotae]MCR6031344.1 blue light sensor protein [Gordonia jinghuaiqii]MTB94983.1 blue light sensor protein [Nocardioides marmotae]QKE02510.1 BLUF domain-containing protein [Nocardioides marmotae]
MLLSLTYVSSAVALAGAEDLVGALEDFRPRNHDRGITGVLLYRGGNIIQVLEGPAEQVERTFAAIERDPRHRGVIVLLREQVEQRAFPDWSMGFRDVSGVDLDREDGFTDFLRGHDDPTTGEDGHAEVVGSLLRTFRESMR